MPSYSLPSPPTCTVGSPTPPTTCALVITLPGAKTKPVPSSTLLQLGAVPTTFTIEALACSLTGLVASPGSGALTSVMGSLEKGLNTWGKPLRASVELKSENHVLAWAGRTRDTPRSTLELRTSLPSVGSEVPHERRADQPGHQEHGDHIDQGAAGRVERARR